MTFLQIQWDVDPVMIDLFGKIELRYYGLLFVAGLWLGHQAARQLYKKEGIPVERLDTLTTYIIVGTVVGARLGHCLFYDWTYYSEHLLEIILPFSQGPDGWKFTGIAGLASHGGVIGTIIAILLYCRKFKEEIFSVFDKIAVGSAITAALIRLGNLFNSEIYGKATNGDWGFVFLRDDNIARHPTQLYESATYFIIFFIIRKVYLKGGHKSGYVLGLFLIMLFSARFLIEFLKENQVAFEDAMTLNMGQLLSVPFVLAGIVLMWKRK